MGGWAAVLVRGRLEIMEIFKDSAVGTRSIRAVDIAEKVPQLGTWVRMRAQ